MTTVTIEKGFYRNGDVAGTFELVQDFTSWGGAREGDFKRRVGTAGDGYLKVMIPGRAKPAKVTVVAVNVGYAVGTTALEQEIANLRAQFEAATGRERDNLRKKLRRREAKLGC
jgi:hypothetical protein